MLGDFNAKDNAVRVGNAHGLLAGELPRQVVATKRRREGISPKSKKCFFGLAAFSAKFGAYYSTIHFGNQCRRAA